MTTEFMITAPAVIAVGALGVAWNAFGVFQFVNAATASRDHLIGMGMTVEQAAITVAMPGWMVAAFAVGVFAGLLGCVLLLLRRRQASSVLALSLAAYVLLFIGDITEGVFAAFGAGQVAILTCVVLIAAGLLWFTRTQPRQVHPA